MRFRHLVSIATLASGVSCALPAAAQLHLPSLPLQLPPIPAAPDFRAPAAPATRPIESALDPRNLLGLRQLAIRNLLQRYSDLVEADPSGEPIVRGEIVVLAPAASALEAARADGYTVARESALEGIDARMVVLRAPLEVTTARALQRLRQLDGQGSYDFNHLYLGAGELRPSAAVAQRTAPREAVERANARRVQFAVGLIDGGVDLHHPALSGADIRVYGCSGDEVPDAHGTGVASLLVGRAPGFAGAAPQATLYAADVYCGRPAGGAATQLVQALAWMAREQVPVINISLVGPANRTLERAVRILIARGHVIVAAVGNEGPAAPPLYPAAYPGVIGVTAVDARQRVLPEAARGPQVAFAAPGADMAVAASGGGYARARGTSFAAPLVAGLLASAAGGAVIAIEPSAARRAIDALARGAVDLGPPGRDDTYGFGLLGEDLRVDPQTLR